MFSKGVSMKHNPLTGYLHLLPQPRVRISVHTFTFKKCLSPLHAFNTHTHTQVHTLSLAHYFLPIHCIFLTINRPLISNDLQDVKCCNCLKKGRHLKLFQYFKCVEAGKHSMHAISRRRVENHRPRKSGLTA